VKTSFGKEIIMDAIEGVTIEKYAELCALMADTGQDTAKQEAIAQANGLSPTVWNAAKDGFTKLMMDPKDMGKTAMAFMKAMQEAQAKARGGAEPCSLETFAKVHAEMAFRRDAKDSSKKIDFNIVLQENGFAHHKWLEMENYWTPIVRGPEGPRFVLATSQKFDALIAQNEKRILGIG
jgi:hypothetical protein